MLTKGRVASDRLRGEILRLLADFTGRSVDLIDQSKTFIDLGIDSAAAVRMMAELSQLLTQELSPTLPWEYPTPDALTEHLCGDARPTQPVLTKQYVD